MNINCWTGGNFFISVSNHVTYIKYCRRLMLFLSAILLFCCLLLVRRPHLFCRIRMAAH